VGPDAPAVRHDIAREIARTAPSGQAREIVKVGHVDSDAAIIYTEQTTVRRSVERWVRGPDGWRLESSRDLEEHTN
jgi:hypothetical protein